MVSLERLHEINPELAETMRKDARFLIALFMALEVDDDVAQDYIEQARDIYYQIVPGGSDDQFVAEALSGFVYLVDDLLWNIIQSEMSQVDVVRDVA